MTTSNRAATYLDSKGFTALADALRNNKSTPRRTAAYLLDQQASILRIDELKVLKRWAGVK